MRVIDARSGEDLVIGKPVRWSDDGESVTLLAVEPGWWTCRLLIRSVHLNPMTDKLESRQVWVNGQVRYLHPAFFLQRVAFLPS